jgi:hypothetical protein
LLEILKWRRDRDVSNFRYIAGIARYPGCTKRISDPRLIKSTVETERNAELPVSLDQIGTGLDQKEWLKKVMKISQMVANV